MSEKRNQKLLHGLISSCDVGLAELTRDLQALDPTMAGIRTNSLLTNVCTSYCTVHW